MRFAPNGQVFVAEKSGMVLVYDGVGDVTPTAVVDLRTQVHNFWDRGLLGLAIDPGYPARPHLYALYTHDALPGGTAPRWGTAGGTSDPCPNPPGATGDGCVVQGRLSRIDVNPVTMQGSEVVLLESNWCGPPGGVPDPQCAGNPLRSSERPWQPACGLGFELALALPLLRAARARRRRLG